MDRSPIDDSYALSLALAHAFRNEPSYPHFAQAEALRLFDEVSIVLHALSFMLTLRQTCRDHGKRIIDAVAKKKIGGPQ